MKLLAINCESLHWNIHKNDPAKYTFRSIPNCTFINPRIYERLNAGHIDRFHAFPISPEQVIITCSQLALLVPDDFSFGSRDNSYEEFLKNIRKLLLNIRYYSKQYTIDSGSDNVGFSFEKVSSIPEFPDFEETSPSIINERVVGSAISWEHLIAADSAPDNFIVPVFDIVLLDAISAFSNSDYRRAILYAAMAIEIVANTKLEEAYERAIQESPTDLRIICFHQAGGTTIKKDPIYESLSEATNFSKALHERPLYLLKKSLLVENDVLYKTALKLYKTRNKIAHHGEPPTDNGDHYFVMNYSSALEAVKCAVDIFKWFGISDPYFIPTGGFYQIDSPGNTAEYRRSLKPF